MLPAQASSSSNSGGVGSGSAVNAAPAPDKEAFPTGEAHESHTIQFAGSGSGGSGGRVRSAGYQQLQQQPHRRSRHAGRSTRIVGQPDTTLDGISWGVHATGGGSPIARVKGVARRNGRGHDITSAAESIQTRHIDDSRSEAARAGGRSVSSTADAPAPASDRKSTTTSPLSGSDIFSGCSNPSVMSVDSRVAWRMSLAEFATAGRNASRSGSDRYAKSMQRGAGFEGRSSGSKGARVPRGADEQNSSPDYFELLTTTPKVRGVLPYFPPFN